MEIKYKITKKGLEELYMELGEINIGFMGHMVDSGDA
jgi:hypothetical protein